MSGEMGDGGWVIGGEDGGIRTRSNGVAAGSCGTGASVDRGGDIKASMMAAEVGFLQRHRRRASTSQMYGALAW